MDLIEEFRVFLVDYLRGRESMEKRGYPWKESWRYVVSHSMRVEKYACDLIEAEGGIGRHDALLIRAAALMHDIGSMEDRRNHNKLGARIVKRWLKNNPEIKNEIDAKALASMIVSHRKKDGKEKNIPLAILKDADILDELGAMSIFMIAHEVDPSRHDYYSRILDLLERNEFAFFRKQRSRLTTSSAKKIMKRKFFFIKEFAAQLRDELKGTGQIQF